MPSLVGWSLNSFTDSRNLNLTHFKPHKLKILFVLKFYNFLIVGSEIHAKISKLKKNFLIVGLDRENIIGN
jgi:hypothetical protein